MKLEEQIIKAIGGHLGAGPEQLTSAVLTVSDVAKAAEELTKVVLSVSRRL